MQIKDIIMNAQEMKEKYWSLYEYMAGSRNPENMKAFGKVMTQMMYDMIGDSPSKAEEYINRLESIKWINYMTPAEADRIVNEMIPKGPWSREQWRQAMEKYGYELEEWPCYNKCALYVTMSMIYSDSSETLAKYAGEHDVFEIIHALALDKLKDKDKRFSVRSYFDL